MIHSRQLIRALCLGCLTLCSACAINPADPVTNSYPAAYRDALSDFPGAADVAPETIAEFTNFLSELGSPDSGERAAQLYAAHLHFSDALLLTNNREVVVEHFAGLSDSGASVDVTMHDIITQQADIYLIWSMQARFRPVRREVSSDTLGITHIRFNDENQVVLHQDFWDTGLGFYSHVPVLGSIVNAIARRFDPAPDGQ